MTTNTERTHRGPMHGIRIVELTAAASGPYATMVLAEQGADVIKIEPPVGGDFMRALGTQHNGVTGVFAGFNRNKRSVAIDLKQADGVDLVKCLVATADVFVHNFRPGVIERLGLAEADLRAAHPELITVTISGFGLVGPSARRPAYDSIMQGAAGLAAHQADEFGTPQLIRNAMCDKTTALTAAQLITAALFARERGAGGQHVHLSMLHAAIAFLWPDGMQDVTFLERDATEGTARATSPPVRRTRDGFISITTLLDREFEGLCTVLGLDALRSDPRFVGAGERSRNADALHPIVNAALLEWDTLTLAEGLAGAGVPHAVVNTVETIHEDPQVIATAILAEQVHPAAGRMRVPKPVGDFGATPISLDHPAPMLGEHTDEVLTELGLDAEAIANLRSRAVIG